MIRQFFLLLFSFTHRIITPVVIAAGAHFEYFTHLCHRIGSFIGFYKSEPFRSLLEKMRTGPRRPPFLRFRAASAVRSSFTSRSSFSNKRIRFCSSVNPSNFSRRSGFLNCARHLLIQPGSKPNSSAAALKDPLVSDSSIAINLKASSNTLLLLIDTNLIVYSICLFLPPTKGSNVSLKVLQ